MVFALLCLFNFFTYEHTAHQRWYTGDELMVQTERPWLILFQAPKERKRTRLGLYELVSGRQCI